MKLINWILDAIADRVLLRIEKDLEKELAKWKPLASRPPVNSQTRPRTIMVGDDPSTVEWTGSRQW
jgi:hypothetical protein